MRTLSKSVRKRNGFGDDVVVAQPFHPCLVIHYSVYYVAPSSFLLLNREWNTVAARNVCCVCGVNAVSVCPFVIWRLTTIVSRICTQSAHDSLWFSCHTCTDMLIVHGAQSGVQCAMNGFEFCLMAFVWLSPHATLLSLFRKPGPGRIWRLRRASYSLSSHSVVKSISILWSLNATIFLRYVYLCDVFLYVKHFRVVLYYNYEEWVLFCVWRIVIQE